MNWFLKNLLLLIFLFPQCNFAQKARVFELHKLYEPQVAEGNFVAWKNDGILIPIRYESKSKREVSVTYTGPDADFQLYQLHDIWADFSAGNCGEAKTNGIFNKVKVPDRAENKPDFKFLPSEENQWVIVYLKISSFTNSGIFPYSITFSEQGKKTEVKGKLTIKDRVVKDLASLDFFSDFWQFPIAMADHHQIKPWSQSHWQKLEVMFDQLCQINQNSITTSVFWDLYNTRIRPFDEMMIQVKKSKEGRFTYDFRVFDKYVELAHSKGISRQVAVHNLFPWNEFLFYYDESSSSVVSVQAKPGTVEYRAFWKPFLIDFSEHLKQKGWLEKTVLFIDERDPNTTLELAKWIKTVSPEFKLGYAGDFYPFLSEWIQDYSMPVNVVVEPGELKKRVLSSQKTSLYTSCFEKENQPNLLLTSDYRDIYFLTQLAKAKGYDGMLRWAFNLWTSDILQSAIYSDLPSGDAHLIYPDGQVSLRFLVLKDALEEMSKLETISRVQDPAEMIQATNRYFLINVEAERNQMIQAMKNYLND
ncbi:DUF4091 domain-containing protein [Algoriphagus sp.]|uniref:DUF4091 domain-containing protein n=1 Tax=Algoriphagus sp. TaxID=1872435 RepID=UPI00391DF3BB